MARHIPEGRRLRPVEIVADYELVILDELDLAREAANASQLRRNFQSNKLGYVPAVYWDYTARNVLTMERISGIPVTDVETLRALGTDLKLLGERGVEIFFTQVFRDNFFHADMHPGNIFVDASDPADPTYIAVDCAIVGSLSTEDQYYLARNLLGVFRQDYHEVAKLHVECGWVPPGTRIQDFEAAMRAVCEPVFERPISEISFGQLLLVNLFQTAARFDMEVQPSLVLLQKDPAQYRGAGAPALPRSQPVGHGPAVPGEMGAGALLAADSHRAPAASGTLAAGATARAARAVPGLICSRRARGRPRTRCRRPSWPGSAGAKARAPPAQAPVAVRGAGGRGGRRRAGRLAAPGGRFPH